ncbi:YtpR family tRNA-binding protein [Scopulibacillus cellulosilyticus]|uniref:YtpR family tRNA-binding protein n=1 Tax=Scopulibacillus cellulosilyticus TaxID=2665665 RepID=A0ABW2PVY4_9BACL
MNIFYNREGVGDTLMIQMSSQDAEVRGVEKKGDMARIFDAESEKTLGYNLFNASKYLNIESENGAVAVNSGFVDHFNKLLKDKGFTDTLTYDDRPSFIIGHVLEKGKHPNADKLSICKVDIGDETLQIVCGAPNVEQGQKVVVARVGAVMPSGMLIKEAELRGVPSFGMICSAKELDLPNAPEKKGILVLDNNQPVGGNFFALTENH